MQETFKQKKNLRTGEDRFDYDKFTLDFAYYKMITNSTIIEMAIKTGMSHTTINQLCHNKYYSDLSINKVLVLCELMNKDIKTYIKPKTNG